MVEAAVVVDVGYAGDEQVVVLAGHQVALHDAFAAADGAFEVVEGRGRLALQGDADGDSHALAEKPVVDLGVVAADGARGLQGLDAAGRCRG